MKVVIFYSDTFDFFINRQIKFLDVEELEELEAQKIAGSLILLVGHLKLY